MQKNRKRYFIVVICMLIQAIPFCISQNIQPLFIPYVINDFNFSLAGFSLIFTFGAVAAAVCSPFLGKLYGQVNIKILFLIGIILSSLGFMGFGFSSTLIFFYILSAISQIGTVMYSGLGVPYIINNWYPGDGRGGALGIAFAGGAIGNVFLQQITSILLSRVGESTTYIIFGAVSLIVGIPLALFFIKLPSGDDLTVSDAPPKKHKHLKHSVHHRLYEGLGAKVTRKDPYFWSFCIGYAIIAIAISALSTQYATYFNGHLGMNATLVGSIGSVFALFCLIGNVSGGILFDRLGTFLTMLLSAIFEIIAIAALLLCPNMHYFAFVFSVAYGLSVYSYMSAPAYMATDIFGKKDSSEILGTITLLFALGFAFGSSIFGLISDHFSFATGWICMLICILIGYALLLFSIKKVQAERKITTPEPSPSK